MWARPQRRVRRGLPGARVSPGTTWDDGSQPCLARHGAVSVRSPSARELHRDGNHSPIAGRHDAPRRASDGRPSYHGGWPGQADRETQRSAARVPDETQGQTMGQQGQTTHSTTTRPPTLGDRLDEAMWARDQTCDDVALEVGADAAVVGLSLIHI